MRWLTVIALLIASSSFGQIRFDPEDLCKIAIDEAHKKKGCIHNKSGGLTGDYDVFYHRMEWTVDPQVYYIQGAITTYFTSKVGGLTKVHFDCDTLLQIDSVKMQGQSCTYQKLAGDLLEITVPTPVGLTNVDSVTVYYQGKPNNGSTRSFSQSSHGSDSIIYTLSEPYGAKDWWPCKQNLNDKIDSVDILVTVPMGNRVGSNGVLVDTDTSGAWVTHHWQHRYPEPAYLIAIAVTNYAAYSEFVNLTTGTIEILNYVYPEDSATLVTESPTLWPFFTLFDSIFEPYPYMNEKYGHAQWEWGGGMEHSTMSFMGSFNYELLAHELAHQWFGDKITCGSWEDIWLNEGFASYCVGLVYNRYSPELYWPLWKSIQVDKVIAQPDGSVWVDDTTNVSRIFDQRLSYRKASMLLHMLRWKLGDDDFFQGIRNYMADPTIAWGYARTNDLKSHLEAQSGQSLTEFFNDWFYGEGHPKYRVEWNQNAGGLWVTLSQSTSDPTVSLFEMPVPIYFSGQGQDTIIVFNQTQNVQLFQAAVPFTVDSIVFDPEIWLVAELDTILAGIEQVKPPTGINVYPNPGTTTLQIDGCFTKLSVIDQLGRHVKDYRGSEGKCWQQTIDISDWADGIYLLKFDYQTIRYVVASPPE